jgi:1,2-diacylglycerol 3-beta-galactosyltransferase
LAEFKLAHLKMKKTTSRKPHIVFYFSDTGGGHRSAAEAIIEAVHLEYGDSVTTEMVDTRLLRSTGPAKFIHIW